MALVKLPVLLTPGEDGYVVAQVPVIPGCVSQGKTREEALRNIREAALLCLESREEEGWDLPSDFSLEELEVAVPEQGDGTMDIRLKAKKLVEYMQKLLGFKVVKSMDGDYRHMGATISDAILQSGISYDTVVRPKVKRLIEQYPDAKTTSVFLSVLSTVGPSEVLDWKRGYKPQLVVDIATFLASRGVETETQLRQWLEWQGSIDQLRAIKYIGEKTVNYLKILVGIPTNAVDRHLRKFCKDADIAIRDDAEAHAIINEAADLMTVDRGLLDHSIWKFMTRKRAREC